MRIATTAQGGRIVSLPLHAFVLTSAALIVKTPGRGSVKWTLVISIK